MKPLMILLALIGAGIILITIIITQSNDNAIELEKVNCKTNNELYMSEFPFVFFSS
jgi:hypothetical protein